MKLISLKTNSTTQADYVIQVVHSVPPYQRHTTGASVTPKSTPN
jgi:hypothetical protein